MRRFHRHWAGVGSRAFVPSAPLRAAVVSPLPQGFPSQMSPADLRAQLRPAPVQPSGLGWCEQIRKFDAAIAKGLLTASLRGCWDVLMWDGNCHGLCWERIPETVESPLCLLLVGGKPVVVVWRILPSDDLPSFVKYTCWENCTVLDLSGASGDAELKEFGEALGRSIDRSDPSVADELAGLFRERTVRLADEYRKSNQQSLTVDNVSSWPIPPFFIEETTIRNVLRPLPRCYISTKVTDADENDLLARRVCSAEDVFANNPYVRVAMFPGASGSGKTMSALHAMDNHRGSVVFGLFVVQLHTHLPSELLRETSPPYLLLEHIKSYLCEEAVALLRKWGVKPGKKQLGDLCCYVVADEMESHPRIAACIINDHLEIQQAMADAICRAFCPGSSCATFSLYVSMAGSGLGLRADLYSSEDSLPRNYHLVLPDSTKVGTEILLDELPEDGDFRELVRGMCVEESPEPSRNVLPSLITNARCAAFAGRQLKLLRGLSTREAIEDAMGLLLSSVCNEYVASNSWGSLASKEFEPAVRALLTLAVTKPHAFHLLDPAMVKTLSQTLGAISDVPGERIDTIRCASPSPSEPLLEADAARATATKEWCNEIPPSVRRE